MGRLVYHKDLKRLEDDVLELTEMVIKAIGSSVKSLMERDIEAGKEIVRNDIHINNKRYDIEERCLLLIATQQPMAGDLRVIAAILSIITDLERMADHAEGTASINVMIGEGPLATSLEEIPKMSELGISMLDRCIKAFKERDKDTARAICDEDDAVDLLYENAYEKLINLMINDPKTIEGATYLMWVAHNLERIADRVTNIAERVVFMVTGKLEEINVSKY